MADTGDIEEDWRALDMESMDVNANEMAGGVGSMVLAEVVAGVAVMEAGLADCCLVESGWVR